MNERAQQMLDMYMSGRTYSDIAHEFKVSRQRVHQIIGDYVDHAHYGQAKKDARAERIESAHRRYLDGESTLEEEAEREGVKVSSLVSAFYDFGLKLSSRHIPSPEHGTAYRYTRGCRCTLCTEAVREKYRERVRRGPPQHGTESAYFNYGCRCDECRSAGSLANRRRRIARLQRKAVRLPND